MSNMPETSRRTSCVSDISELSNSVFMENSTDIYPSSSNDEDSASQHRSAELGYPSLSSQSTENRDSNTMNISQYLIPDIPKTSQQRNVPIQFHRQSQQAQDKQHDEDDQHYSHQGEVLHYREYSQRRWGSTISEASKSETEAVEGLESDSPDQVNSMAGSREQNLNGHVLHQARLVETNCSGVKAEYTSRSTANGKEGGKNINSGETSGYLADYRPTRPTRKSVESSSRTFDLSSKSRSDAGEVVERSYNTVMSSSRSSQPRLSVTSFLPSGRSTPSAGVKRFKLILVGDPGVGKSTFLKTLAKGHCLPFDTDSPLFSDHVTIATEYEGQRIELEIQDTAGQERFRSLTASYYRYAQGCLLFFNVHHKESFQNISSWIDDINMYNSQNHALAVVLVGMLHGASRKHSVDVKRSNSRRGETSILTPPMGTCITKSFNNNNNNNNNNVDKHDHVIMARSPVQRRGSLKLQQEQKHNHHEHDYHLSSYQHQLRQTSSMPQEGSSTSDDKREVPLQQAEHMASVWDVAYKEVDAESDYDSAMDAVHMLLGLVLVNALQTSKTSVDTIRPGSNTKHNCRGRSSVSGNGRVVTSHCCFHC